MIGENHKSPDIQGLFADALRHHQAGRPDDAKRLYQRVLASDPRHADTLHMLGLVAHQAGRYEIATKFIGAAIGINGSVAAYFSNLGAALKDLGQCNAAVIACNTALCLDPGFALAHYNLGLALYACGRIENAVMAYRAALRIASDCAEFLTNLGVALHDTGCLDAAAAAYGGAICLKPDFSEVYYNLSLTHLLAGRFEEGWRDYEWRWRTTGFLALRRDFRQPLWQGESLAGKTILLHTEQGMGDAIQFCRYAPLVAAMGGRVILEVHSQLVRLLDGLGGADQIVAKEAPLPPFDLHCPLMSLPRAFGTRIDSVPAQIPYIAADPARVDAWRDRLSSSGFRVGIAWQGNPTYKNDRDRSIPLACFAALARVPGVRLISLQKVHGLEQLNLLPKGMTVETLGPDFDEGENAFIDAAAVIRGLDLIISADTAIAHLAGALGCPVWLPLAKIPHWVWMLDRDDTPWYPTMRLFRQVKREEWQAVFERMAEELVSMSMERLWGQALDAHQEGQLAAAEKLYRLVLAVDPGHAEALHLMGILAHQSRRNDVAADLIGKAINIDAAVAARHSNLGIAMKGLGRLEEAIAAYDAALRLDPQYADAHSNRGNALKEVGLLQDALAAYEAALRIRPDFSEAHSNRAIALAGLGRFSAALEACHIALCLRPEYAEAHCNRGNTLKDLGRPDLAIAAYEAAVRIRPDFSEAFSNLLLCMHYPSEISETALTEAARNFGARFDSGAPPLPFANAANRERRLRIGYVSGDFRFHSVSYFLAPVLSHHDRRQVEVFCYSNSSVSDGMTERLRSAASHWRAIAGLPDDAVARLIGSDEIDILVDLSGHSAANRLPLFARRAAPVQVTWLGYPDSTGLGMMDYRLVDEITDPVGREECPAGEALYRLPQSFLCYEAPPDAPPPRSAERPRHRVTFGSFNNLAKLSNATVDAWAALLVGVPEGQLLIKGLPFRDPAICSHFLGQFVERGVDAHRICLMEPMRTTADHLSAYDEVDIALDPFPYNGTTTTCEALWMGVPVVTLRGRRHSGRVGASLLNRLGLDDLIAENPADYIRIAAALAVDSGRRRVLGETLRGRMAGASLCNARMFTRDLEAAYRTMWETWCETR